jgi:maltooligosyltrehalose trehalohydrolase
MRIDRTFPIGAEVIGGGRVSFRVWAPRLKSLAVELMPDSEGRTVVPLTPEENGYFAGEASGVAGMRYRLRTDRGSFPDPASRFQPEGPHGPSQIVDPAFAWTDSSWRGRPREELVIYELHLGTFTAEGTWRAAMRELDELARIGITMIEVMPVADFPGDFGWGYDGVNLFAPCRLYGTPGDAKAFVDRAHQLGIMVILDVVYNHIGPDGNYLREFSPHYFSTRYANEWGDPLNFDGEHSASVRELFVTNARYWIREYHFDGLRLDATQQIFDASPVHVLADIADGVRAEAGGRISFVVGENEYQHPGLIRPRNAGGCGLDALWNDDFHHSAYVAATGRAEAYYSGYRGRAQEFVSAAKYGFLYQGSLYRWQKKRRGRPGLDMQPRNFVQFLENHDQVANSLAGARLHQLTSPGRHRALTALLLLSPHIPLFFQGEEFDASAPFLYFADHYAELQAMVASGRRKFLQQFPSVVAAESLHPLADPGAKETWMRCKLDFNERGTHRARYQMCQDLLALRRAEPAITKPARIDGAVLGEPAFVLRLFHADGDRLLVVNLGTQLELESAPEPLLAPLDNHGWRILWSSESPAYGGNGTPPLETASNWTVPGDAAVLLCPDENAELPAARISQEN